MNTPHSKSLSEGEGLRTLSLGEGRVRIVLVI
jgi:hypothetical protein